MLEMINFVFPNFMVRGGEGGDGGTAEAAGPTIFFSDTVMHLRVRNISRKPIENISYTGTLILDM